MERDIQLGERVSFAHLHECRAAKIPFFHGGKRLTDERGFARAPQAI